MNIVIVGVGEVGRHLALSLTEQGHSLSVIESSEPVAAELSDRFDARVLCASGTAVSTLARADVGEADLLLALSGDDNANLVAASLGKAMGARRTIARVHASTLRDRWLFDVQQHFGIDHLFSTQRLAAIELAKFVRHPEGLLVGELARGRIEVQQVDLTPDSPLLGRPLITLGLPARLRIGSIHRGTRLLVPGRDDRLEAGDRVTLFGAPRLLSEILPRFSSKLVADEDVSVVIFGGGEYGLSLAQMLEGRRFRVRLLERDPRLCRRLSEVLQRTVILQGDATSVQQLKEEQVGTADFFIAASEDDEDNVMACLQAKSLGTRYCLTLIHRADYADVVSRNSAQLQIRAAVSPREATRADLLRYISTERLNPILQLPEGAEIGEALIRPDTPIAGRTVADVPWPPGSGLVALLRGSEATVPGPEDIIRTGDLIYALISPGARKPFLKLLQD